MFLIRGQQPKNYFGFSAVRGYKGSKNYRISGCGFTGAKKYKLNPVRQARMGSEKKYNYKI